MRTVAPKRKPSARRKAAHPVAHPAIPKPPAEMGALGRKLDVAFREIAGGQVTVREVEVTAPREYTSADVRALRESMQVSQGVFALLVGVSSETVEHWEQGIIGPRPIARRLLDMITADPLGYRAMLLHYINAP